jgi:hypothetical protein
MSTENIKQSMITQLGYFKGMLAFQDFLEANAQAFKRNKVSLAVGLILRTE